MRSRLTTTALCSTLITAGIAMLAGPASAGDYGSANSARINHIISGHASAGHYGGRTSYVAPGYGYGDYGNSTGYRSSHGYDDYGYGGDIVYRDGRVGYDYVGSHDLDDFGSHVVRYVTVSPRTEVVERPIVVVHRGEPVETDASAGDTASVSRADVGRPLFFGSGSTELSDESRVKLDKIGEIIAAYSDTEAQILISAYTDASGTEEQNQAISRKRIEAVQSYLAEKFQIPAAEFVTAAVGAANVEETKDPYAAENRRVVISLLNLDLSREGGAPVAAAQEAAPAMQHGDHAEAPSMMHEGHAMAETAAPVVEEAPAASDARRCSVPAYPHAGGMRSGRLISVGFQDIDDFGGGRLIEVCDVSH
ncbi:OmpA family protein [Aurantimonas sp. VKM B-3413]|uniref:OmpA family protein n=1 Tax=Aurantimonas sp. VKM B-3413 TaxID=2779401 RepID=UPI001E4C39B9|nr:OmpA family protein [Aurantimonas sp. VKM B-3413]MCB8837750.1 OmpA family protein [Aurantimonas sp. VKM B-3413]